MSFSQKFMWRDKPTKGPARTIIPGTGRTWSRRLRWLEDSEGRVKLKLEIGDQYKEILTDSIAGKTIYDRFKAGGTIDDCVSILGNPVPKALQSKRAGES